MAARHGNIRSASAHYPSALAAQPFPDGPTSCCRRDKETTRLQHVLAHPQFKADPIAAVTAHLAATMPPAPSAPKSKQAKRTKGQRRMARQMDTA